MLATAARAVGLGMGSLPSITPPPLYAYDYDTGRLAITTPRYSTAIVPDDREVLGYGGIDLARLFGPGQRVASGTGGRPPGAFGLVVYAANGRTVLAGQRPRHGQPLRIVRSPAGRIASPRAYPPNPYAGPFSVVQARGAVSRGELRIASDYRFRRSTIAVRWQAGCRRRLPAPIASARTSRPGAGSRGPAQRRARAPARRRPARPDPPGDVRSVDLGGYRITRLNGPPDAKLFAVAVKPEATNPTPAASLAVQLTARRSFHRVSLAARLSLPAARPSRAGS